MSETPPSTASPKPSKKIKWYWWAIIAVVVFSIISRLGSPDPTIASSEGAATTAEPEKPKLKSADVDKLLSGLRKSKDEFQKIAFYHDATSTKYNNVNSLYVYLGRSESDEVYPHLVIQYAGKDWLFIKAYRFIIDGSTTKTILPDSDVTTDNNGDGVWEVMDKVPDSSDLLTLKEIANSKVAKIRYEGRERIFDRVITDKEKKALKHIIGIYSNFK